MGKISRLQKKSQAGIIHQALMKIQINEEQINADYFTFQFESNTFQSKILKDSRGTGMQNMAALEEIQLLEFHLKPLQIQRAIVTK